MIHSNGPYPWVFLNRTLVPTNTAKVSVLDRGFLYGDGVFETMAVYDGTIFRLDAHLRRLFRSADQLGIEVPVTKESLTDHLYSCLSQNGADDAILRLSLSRGLSERGLSTKNCTNPTLLILCFPPKLYDKAAFHRGIHLILSSIQRTSPAALSPTAKTTNFLNNILAFREAEDNNAAEAIMLNSQGNLAECSTSNLFLVRNGELFTPSLDCGALEGITRQAVIEVGKALGIVIRETTLPSDLLWEANEVFYTNTTALVMPVASIDQNRYSTRRPVTSRLRQALLALIEREAGRFWAYADRALSSTGTQ